jgi:UDP-N-acetyl-D-mannosaminuronate dehydrogenase
MFRASIFKTVTRSNRNINKLYYSTTAKASKNDVIGFIGLGQMGFRMASHLYQKINSPLIICDINQNAINQFISLHKSTLSKKTNFTCKFTNRGCTKSFNNNYDVTIFTSRKKSLFRRRR